MELCALTAFAVSCSGGEDPSVPASFWGQNPPPSATADNEPAPPIDMPMEPVLAAPGPEAPAANINGFWAIFGQDMDGTVVELSVSGNAISGRGCLSGWVEPEDEDQFSQCGEVSGAIDGSQVTFQFQFDSLLDAGNTYGVRAEVLDAGERMTGTHFYASMPGRDEPWEGSATAFRPEDEYWPWRGEPAPTQWNDVVLRQHISLTLQSGGDTAGVFTAGRSYELRADFGGLEGELGLFAPVDLSYEEPEPGVVFANAGPAPQPDAEHPVRLRLELRDSTLVGVEAGLPTGEVLHFAP